MEIEWTRRRVREWLSEQVNEHVSEWEHVSDWACERLSMSVIEHVSEWMSGDLKMNIKFLKPSLPPPPLNHLQIIKTNMVIESLTKTKKSGVEIDYTVSWSFATDPTITKDLFQNFQARIEFPLKHQERWNTSYSLLEKLCRQVSCEKSDTLNQQCLENYF